MDGACRVGTAKVGGESDHDGIVGVEARSRGMKGDFGFVCYLCESSAEKGVHSDAAAEEKGYGVKFVDSFFYFTFQKIKNGGLERGGNESFILVVFYWIVAEMIEDGGF